MRPSIALLCLLAAPVSPGGTTPPAQPQDAARNQATPRAPASADALFASLSTMPGFEATFRETKTLALLKAPLVSTGRLYYVQPGFLVRQVDAPAPSTIYIRPGGIEMRDARGSQQVDLSARPDLKLFVESFVRVVAGDAEALATVYDIDYRRAATGEGWTLTLTPKVETLAALVDKVELVGQGLSVSSITVLERSGDRSVITIELVDPKRRFTADELREIFGLAIP